MCDSFVRYVISVTDKTVQSPFQSEEHSASEPPKANPVDVAVLRETNRLCRLQELLQGVPPPPSITIPRMDCAEVLTRLRENISLLDEAINHKKNNGKIFQIYPYLKPNHLFLFSEHLHQINLNWPENLLTKKNFGIIVNVYQIIYRGSSFECTERNRQF